MRLASLLASIGLASSLLTACSSDGTLVDLPHARDGLNGGSGSPTGVVTLADGGAMEEAYDAAVDGSAPAPVRGDPIATVPIEAADASPDAEGDTATADGGIEAKIAGCTCGCSDPCLTVLIVACKAPTALLGLVCPKVPATCTCEATCTPPPPAPPSLDACATQFLLTGT